jgi:FKBP-type peptidyl-prolyl cis-trans isomerase SlyD
MTTITEVANDAVVEFEYTLTDKEGKVLDKSEGRGPLAYIQGKQNIVPGLEKQMTGKKVGDKFTANVPCGEAYGEYHEGMVQAVDKSQFDGVDNLQIGMQFQVQTEQGLILVMVKEIQEDKVVLDGNHPLAGVDLTFDVEVVSLRAATEEELAHGHLHMGAGCCGGGCHDEESEGESCCSDSGESCCGSEHKH